jgi:ATP-dependent Lon protease
VLIPWENARELRDLPVEVRDAVQFHPVRSMDEVLALALRAVPTATEVAQVADMPQPRSIGAVAH